MPNLPNDFDQIAIVVDWLDACRLRNLDALLDLYAQDASLECECEGGLHTGRTRLEAYWGPRLAAMSSSAFWVDAIMPVEDGVVLDYVSFADKPVRIVFTFNGEGKILQSRCTPSARG